VELILIRHAQPDWAPGGIARNDPELSGLGVRQAERLGERAASWEGVAELLVSPLVRARQTAEAIAAALHLEPTVLPWLAEIRNPDEWEGSPVDQVDRILEEVRLRSVDAMWDGLPGGETFRDFHSRVLMGMERSLAERAVRRHDTNHPHLWTVEDDRARLVVVAHGGTNAVLLGALLGLEPVPWEWDRFIFAHASVASVITRPVERGRAFGLSSFGDVSHLDPEMVTE
jgi:broad specificity phosphatase PhoE